MLPIKFVEQERKLARERTLKHKGTASIEIKVLEFPYEESEEVDEKDVARVKKLFSDQGEVNRLDFRNHIPAVISERELADVMAASNISAERMLADSSEDYPKLCFPAGYRLPCLHGRHRVLAGAAVLPPGDKRWIVDLYLNDLNNELKADLIEEYSCEKIPDDGKIYRKIREYQGYNCDSNPHLEKRWWARLYAISTRKGDNLNLILSHPDFKAAFDVQLDIPGLGGGMRLGTWHKIRPMRCPERCLFYLHSIREDYSKFLQRKKEAMLMVDRATVKAIERKAPGACRADRKELYKKLRKGQIFSNFNERDRDFIWQEMLSFSSNRLIPSLHSFFEDVNYLQGPADLISRLIELTPKDTISSALGRYLAEANLGSSQCLIQITESTFETRLVKPEDQFDILQRQIWMGAMRDYLDFLAVQERETKNLLAKPSGKPGVTVLRELANLAHRLGFESDKINELMQGSADRKIARNFLLQARNPDRYRYDADAFEKFVDQMVLFVATAQIVPPEGGTAADEAEDSDESPKRCGIPKVRDHKRDRALLFFDKLHNTDDEQCETMTSFFVRRSVYLTFFGELSYPIQSLSQDQIEEARRIAMKRKRQEEEIQEENKRQRTDIEQRQAEVAKRQAEAAKRRAVEKWQRAIKEKRQKEAAEKKRAEAERRWVAVEQQRLATEEQQRLAAAERRIHAEQDLFEGDEDSDEDGDEEVQTQTQTKEDKRTNAEEDLVETNKDVQTNKGYEDPVIEEATALTTGEREKKRLSELWSERGEQISPSEKEASEARNIDSLQKSRRITQIDLEDLMKPMTEGSAETDQASRAIDQDEPNQPETNQQIDEDTHKVTDNGRSSASVPETASHVYIDFVILKRDKWELYRSYPVDSSNQLSVKSFTERCLKMRQRFQLLDRDYRLLQPDTCFEDVTADGSNRIYLVPGSKIITDQLGLKST